MLKIGITGGIACGKSTILSHLKELGHEVFSSDDVFKDIFNLETVQNWLKEQIALRKGDKGLAEYQTAGKTLIRYLVLSDPSFKADYEALVHPMVIEAMLSSGVNIAEVPLLFESGAENCFEHVWVVACDPETQIGRLMSRMKCDRDYAIAWINGQMPLKQKIERADRVIYTDVSPSEVFKIVDKAVQEDLS